MSNEQDLRAMTLTVAKWCGYTNIRLTEMFDEVADHNGHTRVRLPNFAESLDAMRKVEDEIERRGLEVRYMEELVGVLSADRLVGEWEVLRATAAKRLQAAYRAIQEAA